MRHLVLARSYLLHHEEREAHKAKTVAEVFSHNATGYHPTGGGLQESKERVDHKGEVERAAQVEQGAAQTKGADVVAGQDGTYHKGDGAECAVVQADGVHVKSQAAFGNGRLQEERNNLHDKALGKAVQDNEENVVGDVLLAEEVQQYFL